MKGMQDSVEDKSGDMYTYNEDKNGKNIISGALGRTGNRGNRDDNLNNNKEDIPLKENIDRLTDTVTIHIDQSPPLYWMFFIVFAIIQVMIILLIAFYYGWQEYYTKPKSINENTPNDLTTIIPDSNGVTGAHVYKTIEHKYHLFQEVNIMIYFGFGFLRAFLKHYSWTGVALTFIAGVLSTEFGLFMLLGWSAIFQMEWNYGQFNFQSLLDANLCSTAVIISMGSILGKISVPQYLILILVETIGVTFHYTLMRQVLHIIDIGGTLTIHLYGALFGATFSFLSYLSRSEKERITESRHLGTNYYSNVFSIIGGLILITYWPAFNTCLLRDDLERPTTGETNIRVKYEAIINTYLAIIGSIIGSFSSSPLLNNGKLVLQDILNSSFSGGIAIGGCCHLINHYWVSIIFGFFTGIMTPFLCNLISQKLLVNKYHDTANTLFYHGIPGFLGGIFTTIFVGNMPNILQGEKRKMKEYVYKYIGTFLNYYDNYENENEIYFPGYAGLHFLALFLTIIIAIACGFLAGFSIKFCNCNIALRYFNDSENFDVTESDPFPWKNENIRLELEYNPRNI